MRWRLSLILVLVPLLFLSCVPVFDQGLNSESEQLEQLIQNESLRFENLLEKMQTLIDSMEYPNDYPVSSVMPEGCLFEILDPEIGEGYKSVLAIPAPKDIKTGLTVERTTEGWVYYQRTTFLNPDTNVYIVHTMAPQRYTTMQGVPADFRDYPRRLQVDFFKSYIIVLSPYYIPENVTHGLYEIDGPQPFRDGGNNYELRRIVKQMIDINPYLNNIIQEESSISNTIKLNNKLHSQISIVIEDMDNIVEFIATLRTIYFQPNIVTLDLKGKLTEHRISMNKIRDDLSQLEVDTQEIENWDFSNLEAYHMLPGKVR